MHLTYFQKDSRGTMNIEWLQTSYSFSFANWYDPSRMGWGYLRVLNDDTIAPGKGFDMHYHENMEIITIITKGSLEHKDNLGNTKQIHQGEVQIMSAGTGVLHSEYNPSPTDHVSLFQLWVVPDRAGHKPRYDQKYFDLSRVNTQTTLVGPHGSKSQYLTIHQNAFIRFCTFETDKDILLDPLINNSYSYIFVIDGDMQLSGFENQVSSRDAIGVTQWSNTIHLSTQQPSSFLVIETE